MLKLAEFSRTWKMGKKGTVYRPRKCSAWEQTEKALTELLVRVTRGSQKKLEAIVCLSQDGTVWWYLQEAKIG